MDIAIGRWPEFVHAMNDVYANDDSVLAQGQAVNLLSRLRDHFDEVYRSTAPLLQNMQRLRIMRDVSCGDAPNGLAYEFTTFKGFDVSLSYYTVCLILKLMMVSLNVFLGQPDEAVWSEFCLYCAQMTKYVPYLRQQGKLGSML
ncbi:hypothetical protein ACLX1H_004708 [Fusarium chlamydosporum]